MSPPVPDLARVFRLREGEGRTLAVLGGYLLLCTATTTILSATKNGLFLSVFPGIYIPHVVIAAALLTAVMAVVFSGVIAGTARRSLALWLTVILTAVVIASRWGFGLDPRMAVGVYLLMSVVQVLTLTHAWDFAGDLLTGRQAKRLAPLLGMWASVGALLGGAVVSFAARGLGTENLLFVGAVLLPASLPLLWMVATAPQEHPGSGRRRVAAGLREAGCAATSPLRSARA